MCETRASRVWDGQICAADTDMMHRHRPRPEGSGAITPVKHTLTQQEPVAPVAGSCRSQQGRATLEEKKEGVMAGIAAQGR